MFVLTLVMELYFFKARQGKVKLSLYTPREAPEDSGGWGSQNIQTIAK
jgi:hypothetical protein